MSKVVDVKLPNVKALDKVHSLEFYARPTVEVARDLLGQILCRRLESGEILQAPIVETEAYTEDDPACHAFRGRTPRCSVMFGEAGIAYVYFIYGVYNCLNVVTEPEGTPGAVLIRAIGGDNTNGPGKLCREWQITREQNGVDLKNPTSSIWIEAADPLRRSEIGISKRIGVTSAHERKWRFFVKNHRSVSGPPSLNGFSTASTRRRPK